MVGIESLLGFLTLSFGLGVERSFIGLEAPFVASSASAGLLAVLLVASAILGPPQMASWVP